MERLTTDNPQGNYDGILNMTYIKDKEIYLREFENGIDISLADFCKKACLKKCDRDVSHIDTSELAEFMDCNCFVSYFYHLAVGHAIIREKLKQYEDLEEIDKRYRKNTMLMHEDEKKEPEIVG